MSYQVRCDRCGTTRDIPDTATFANDYFPALPQDWQRLAMGRDRYAEAEVKAQLCAECSALVRRFITAKPQCLRGGCNENCP